MGFPDLDPMLRARVRRLGVESAPEGEFVLYWMRVAMRLHENPALELAVQLARAQGLPLLIYQGLSERYPFASDRHHRFVLEGACDVAAEARVLELRYVFDLQRPGARGPYLRRLAERAACVVADRMPVPHLSLWTERLAERIRTPLLEVDASCLVPLGESKKAPKRAFAFRDAHRDLREALLREELTRELHADTELAALPDAEALDLGFEPFDLLPSQGAGQDEAQAWASRESRLDAAIASCAIDHSIPAIPHTRGGSQAGYARWAQFRDNGLARYAKDRNDPLRSGPDGRGVSCMSAYLHYGHGLAFPHRAAKLTQVRGTRRREVSRRAACLARALAWHWCAHTTDTLEDSLSRCQTGRRTRSRAHGDDPRGPVLFVADARSRPHRRSSLGCGAALAPADPRRIAQQRPHDLGEDVSSQWSRQPGESSLHGDGPQSSLRPRWERDPKLLRRVLWCFGLFDRPFQPRVSPCAASCATATTTATHAERLDPERVCSSHLWAGGGSSRSASRSSEPGSPASPVPRTLQDHGHEVLLVDKARGPGGRTSTRHAGDFDFDHGACYFTARDESFLQLVRSWQQLGLVDTWSFRCASLIAATGDSDVGTQIDDLVERERFVARPGMNTLAKHLATDLALRKQARVTKIFGQKGDWTLQLEDGRTLTGFDQVLVTTPAPQALPLLAAAPELQDELRTVSYAPCMALLLGFENLGGAQREHGHRRSRPSAPFDAAFVQNSPFDWISCNSSKPGRLGEPGLESWVAHTSPDWSEEHWDDERAELERALVAAFARILPNAGRPAHVDLHRWRYARATTPIQGRRCLHDEKLGLGYAGDAFVDSRIEDAWLSGVALAGRVLAGQTCTGRVLISQH
jgi:predicted NAD/FAD-dependent oxidoreductase/deoxyribodipyrimidine photolyase